MKFRRTCIATLVLALAGFSGIPAAEPAKHHSAFRHGSFEFVLGESFAVRADHGDTLYPEILAPPITTVDFCPWQPADPEVQQVMRPESGYLCELHVMPAQPESEILPKLENLLLESKIRASTRTHPRKVVIGGFKVLRWRYQRGKTRLDHFLLLDREKNYLFVSSPYGSNGSIEAIIAGAKRLR